MNFIIYLSLFLLIPILLMSNVRSYMHAKEVNTIPDHEYLQFQKFVDTFERKYESQAEARRRYRIFRANLKKIQMLNDAEEGTAEYGVTRFADLTKKEFEKYYLGLKPTTLSNEDDQNQRKEPDISNFQLPKEFDWRNFNAVTPVKNQGMCGSCWAFSVTGNVEGQWAIKHGNLLSFSEQELVDCDKIDQGCEGGYMTDGYKAIENLGGLELESDYPYKASDSTCQFSKSKVRAKIVDSLNLTSDETKLAEWLVQNGPISVGINANAMQFYFGGISHPLKIFCSPNNLNHGVLLVGFGVGKTRILKKTLPYWLVKNSWGPSWGEHGYYRLYRGAGACGINRMASSAIVE